jgi:excisionase family DNA binding protein
MEPLAVDVSQGARLVTLSRSRFAQLLALGVIPSIKIGRSRRILIADLQSYLERLRDE